MGVRRKKVEERKNERGSHGACAATTRPVSSLIPDGQTGVPGGE